MVYNAPKIMITGAAGQVGFELVRSLAVLGNIVSLTRSECDISDAERLQQMLEQYSPEIIVNAAAYTAVDAAEREIEKATAVNTIAPRVLARFAASRRALLVHYSTDYVFDGDKPDPYVESDPAGPRSVYGRTKYDGERAIIEEGCEYLIFRTSWVFGAKGGNFLKTMLRLARERESLRVVADQWGAPTSALLIADITSQVLAAYVRAGRPADFPYGLYHLTASGCTNWHEYACYAIEQARSLGADFKVKQGDITPVTTAEYPVAAGRPANSRLCTDKLGNTFGLSLPDWRAGVSHVLNLLY